MSHDVACDVGGGFVDMVAQAPGQPPILLKRPRGAAPLPALIASLLAEAGITATRLRLSTTLATNALAEGTAAPVALLTTQGFTDLPELGRQSRRDPDDQHPPPPTPAWLSPPEWRLGVAGRIAADGREAEPLGGLGDFLERLPRGTPVAICLLFSPLNPAHEVALAQAIRAARPDLPISLSHCVDPALREFERMLATMADAALKPLLSQALSGFPTAPWVLRAEGVLSPLADALEAPLGLATSGPAGGALAVAHWASQDAIGLDIGSTTTEISLVRQGQPLTAREIAISGLHLRCPSLDVASLGLGGGTTLAYAGGRIRLGPAAPPACLGGAQPTLTDAALVAGWLPETLSGLALDSGAARAALVRVFGSADAIPALELAEAHIAEATRRMALRRGIDPVRALLVLGGGAGPLHGCAVAARMGASRALLPPAPGLLSAFGLSLAPAGAALETACDLALEAAADLLPEATRQAAALRMKLAGWGLGATPAHQLEMAYAGQSETLAIPWTPGEPITDIAARFDAEHAARRGHAAGGARRITALRMTARAPLGPATPPSPTHHLIAPLPGPALLHGADATLRIPASWLATPRADGAITLERA